MRDATAEQLPPNVIRSLDRLLAYVSDDEEDDYEQEERPKGHIWIDIKRIIQWREGRLPKPRVKKEKPPQIDFE